MKDPLLAFMGEVSRHRFWELVFDFKWPFYVLGTQSEKVKAINKS